MILAATKNMHSVTHNTDLFSLLALRLICLLVIMALLMMHLRSVRVFRWEHSVSGGLVVTYVIALVGLALCAGIEDCGGKVLQLGVRSIYGMRLITMSIIVILMSIHFRALSLFRWTQSHTGIVVAANVASIIGLSVCVSMEQCGFAAIRAYICVVGGVLLLINAGTIWCHWRHVNDLTRVVADLLGAMGVPLHRQVVIKTSLSAVAALLLLMDFTITMMQSKIAPSP